jgi:hypothetical protein
MSTNNKGVNMQKYGLLPYKIAKSDTEFMVHGVWGSGGTIYNKDTIQNKLSTCTNNNILCLH